MKLFLIPEKGHFYKANLHAHSTVSDGKLSPEELKRIYMEENYSVLAYTDHNVLVDHSELAEENFLPLNGVEYDIYEIADKPDGQRKVCHICMIALSPDNVIQPCYHRSNFIWGNAQNIRGQLVVDESLPDFEREYTPECINNMIKMGRGKGFFVTYNHPVWSQENYPQYIEYHGMHAMEICNYDCVLTGYPDYNPRVYDDILQGGEKIFCIAADDNHNRYPRGSRKFDSFGAFTMIKAEKLDYKAITDALLAGHFYASQGPEIHNLWYENGKLHITCSPADRIALSTGQRRAECVFSENGILLQEASFSVCDHDVYVRLTVYDAQGRIANTNAYFIEDFPKNR